MKDKLDDLIPWLEKLLQSLAKVNPDDDPGEAERRSELARFSSRLPCLVHTRLTLYRSLEYVGKRSLALLEKGKVARVLDKTQDSEEVIALVEKLRQAILIYQVSVRHRQSRRSLTRGTGVTTTVDIQPGRPFGGEFLLPVSHSGTQQTVCRFKASFDVLLKLHQVRWHVHDTWCWVTRHASIAVAGQSQGRVCPCAVGSARSGRGRREECQRIQPTEEFV